MTARPAGEFCTNCHDLSLMRQEAILRAEQAERVLQKAQNARDNWKETAQEITNMNATLRTERDAARAALKMLYECNVWYGQIDEGDRARLLKAKEVLAPRP